MSRSTRSWIAILMVAAIAGTPVVVAAQPRAQGPKRTSSAPAALGIHGFSVVLVVGSLQGTAVTSAEGLPESAKKALSDMKDFLPYKRYQLLDAAWMLCCASSRSGVSGRVRGPDEREYTYHVDPIGVDEPKLNIRFSIREMADPHVPGLDIEKLSDTARLEHTRQWHDAIRERDEAELEMRTVKQKVDVGLLNSPDMEAATMRSRRAAQRVADLQRLAGRSRPQTSSGQNLMDSTFSIALGETVVVGTSRLNGDRALIAILTAASKPTGAPR